FHQEIKASSIWSKVKHLASSSISLNKSLEKSSLSNNLYDSNEIASVSLVAILHVLDDNFEVGSLAELLIDPRLGVWLEPANQYKYLIIITLCILQQKSEKIERPAMLHQVMIVK
ncbi:hypothetical protein S83_067777, partial [Arachis hypogaea]